MSLLLWLSCILDWVQCIKAYYFPPLYRRMMAMGLSGSLAPELGQLSHLHFLWVVAHITKLYRYSISVLLIIIFVLLILKGISCGMIWLGVYRKKLETSSLWNFCKLNKILSFFLVPSSWFCTHSTCFPKCFEPWTISWRRSR